MRLVVDAMGTDLAPIPDIAGAILAAQQSTDTIILVGPESLILAELSKSTRPSNLEVVHAEEVITMTDSPSVVSKLKPNSSIHVGLKLVKDGKADAFITAGNTGAVHAIAMLYTIKRIPGVKRPALTAMFPINNHQIIFLDVGANADAKPEWLAQFAIMGSLYSEKALNITSPRVGLLSNGTEEGKGTQVNKDASEIIQTMPINYVGNVEPGDVLAGNVDVLVSDGFTGNIMLKTFESTARYISTVLRNEIQRGVLTSIGGLLARPAFERTRKRLDTFEIGGAPLLGVNGIVIICHGSSDAKAISNAIAQARAATNGKVISAIENGISHSILSV